MLLSLITLPVFTIFFSNALAYSKIYEQQFRTKRQNSVGLQFVDCVLPPHPENGKWTVISGSGVPGSTIFPNTLLKFSCNRGFKLVPKAAYFICDPDWNPSKMPHCEETLCPPLSSSPTTTVRCFNGSGKRISCSSAVHGSTATAYCAEYHELSKGKEGSIQCLNRKWSDALPVCEPICGREVNKNSLGLSLVDQKKSIPKFPWIATIFKERDSELKYQCSGSLVSSKHVLTAAHCVTNFEDKVEDVEKYQLAAGKSYSAYGDPRDLMAQYVQVGSIVIHPDYTGRRGFFRGDIALIKTKRELRLSPLVQPVCLTGLNNIKFGDDAGGTVSLWGLQIDGSITQEVNYFEIKENDKKCIDRLEPDFVKAFKLEDKICAYLQPKNGTLCTGHSGAGWIFKNANTDRYYIHGIVSLGTRHSVTNCADPAVLCTDTNYYYDFIIEKMAVL